LSNRNFYIVAYDIVNDKRRQKVAKLCESIADRVQGSVFEAYLTTEELKKLGVKADRILDKEVDSIRIYMLCSSCRSKIITHGIGTVAQPPGVTIV
jgi:CRISPR-associated protein Cas2